MNELPTGKPLSEGFAEISIHDSNCAPCMGPGWDLIMVTQKQLVHTDCGTRYTDSGMSYNHNESAVYSVPVYIFGRRANAVIEDLQKQLTTEAQAHRDTSRELSKLQEGNKVLEKAQANLGRDLETYKKHCADAQMSCSVLRERLSQYEADIAKIRQAVGEIKMKEILG